MKKTWKGGLALTAYGSPRNFILRTLATEWRKKQWIGWVSEWSCYKRCTPSPPPPRTHTHTHTHTHKHSHTHTNTHTFTHTRTHTHTHHHHHHHHHHSWPMRDSNHIQYLQVHSRRLSKRTIEVSRSPHSEYPKKRTMYKMQEQRNNVWIDWTKFKSCASIPT
jgi:hypothetical protein